MPTDGPVYVLNAAVSVTQIDADTFLVQPDEGEVFYLDEVSGALWRLLAAPRPRAEIVDAFIDAFPHIDRDKIEADIARALDEMVDRGLVNVRKSAG